MKLKQKILFMSNGKSSTKDIPRARGISAGNFLSKGPVHPSRSGHVDAEKITAAFLGIGGRRRQHVLCCKSQLLRMILFETPLALTCTNNSTAWPAPSPLQGFVRPITLFAHCRCF